MSLSQKIGLLYVLPMLLLGITMTWVTRQIMLDHDVEHVQRWRESLVRSISEVIAEPVINKEQLKVNQAISRVLYQNSNISYIYVVDFDNRVIAHTFEAGVPLALMKNFSVTQKSKHYKIGEQNISEIWSPIIKGMDGRIHIGVNLDKENMYLDNATYILLSLVMVLVIVTVLISNYLGSSFAKPIERLTATLKDYGSGQAELRSDIRSRHVVINLLAESFNKMADEQQQNLSELVESRENLNRAQEIAHIGNWVWNMERGTLHWSDEVYRIFGFEPQAFEADYESFLNSVHKEDRVNVTQAVNSVLEDPVRTYSVEHKIVRPNGEVRWGHEVGEVVTKDGKPVKMIGVVHDITERKKAELVILAYRDELEKKVEERTSELVEANNQLQQLDHLKSMFIASMSHELRTPLNSIIGFTGVLLKGMSGSLNDMQQDQLERVQYSAKHLLSLISDIIDISKIEAGKVDINIEDIEMDQLIAECISNIDKLVESTGNAINFNHQDKILLSSDRTRLSQVIINLLSNAAKYTEDGVIDIDLSKDNKNVVIVINDTGVGMSKENLANLFKPFERFDNSLSVRSGGTGLGLYLTKKLLDEVLHGSIAVESKLGKGTRITVTLPDSFEWENIKPDNQDSIEMIA